jgi:tRNA-dependent cyclodipeptide synthase
MPKTAHFVKDRKRLSRTQARLMANNNNCLLCISVGQSYCQGTDLEAIVDLINDCEFDSCTIIVADKLQRFTKQIRGSSAKDSVLEAIEEGRVWGESNQPILNKLKMKNNVFYWDQWLDNSNYENASKYIENLYQTRKSFKDAFDATVNNFVEREKSRNIDVDINKTKEMTITYLKEELAVAVLWGDYNFNYIAYPNSISSAMYGTLQQIRSNKNNDGLLQWLTIKFDNIHLSGLGFLKNNFKNEKMAEENNDKTSLIAKMILSQIDSAVSKVDEDDREKILKIIIENLGLIFQSHFIVTKI